MYCHIDPNTGRVCICEFCGYDASRDTNSAFATEAMRLYAHKKYSKGCHSNGEVPTIVVRKI